MRLSSEDVREWRETIEESRRRTEEAKQACREAAARRDAAFERLKAIAENMGYPD